MRVLFVCTANICRSPLAAAILAHEAHKRTLDDVVVASAGFLEGGRPVHEHTLDLLQERGIDMSRKRSQKLSAATVDGADLILTMTGEHARNLVGRFPRTISDVYTFRHFATAVRSRPEGQPIRGWLDDLNEANRRAYLGNDEAFDIADPIGEDRPVYDNLAVEFDTSLSWIMDCAFPLHARTS